MSLPGEPEIDAFRSAIALRLGLQFDDGRRQWLADILQNRLRAHRPIPAAGYLESVLGTPDELRILAAQLTVTETYFFRGSEQFQALAELVIPERLKARPHGSRLRLLSAGCASGEEAYSLAILLRERFPDLSAAEIEIWGIDINSDVIQKAKRARYQAWSLREMPAELKEKYFFRDGADFVLDKCIRSMATFDERNLAARGVLGDKHFDVILCRNTIMYLSPEAAQAAVAQLAQALVPNGYLFLGYAETLRGISQDFHLCHSHNTFYYQERGSGTEPRAPGAQKQIKRAPAGVLQDASWVDAIRDAFERIHGLSRECADRTESAAGVPPSFPPRRSRQAASRVDLGSAMVLLQQERLREALEELRRLPREATDDPDVQLLRAGLLTNCGNLEVAEDVCRQILLADDLNAGAHYLSALCRENAGDLQSAMEHDRAAIYLDATFAMPRLHLGRLAKRSADLVTAQRELESACVLFPREDPSRILLYGGGFSREALLALSRAELRACGGSL